MNAAWGSLGLRQQWDVYTFPAAPVPTMKLSFSRPPSPHANSRRPKRVRPLADVDGEGSGGVQKKKRRLRLIFITSRLSLPFSAPPTHIVGRGFSKIAVWAKQKALGRNLLRKAAIMNRIRKHALAMPDTEPLKFELVRHLTMFFNRSTSPSLPSGASTTTSTASTLPDTFVWKPGVQRNAPGATSTTQSQHLPLPPDVPYNPPSPPTSPRRQFIPLPPSPLCLTNYDVFDNEDGYFDSDSDNESDTGSERGSSSRIYSDFNILEPSEPVVDDHDSIAAFDTLSFSAQWLLPTEILKESEKTIEIQLEKERQKEVSFIQFGY
ncbi:hypothetical protein AJ80_03927 [Polytolypa hystricis UAMH7299]|uniref:Uncharacterized protein n=1 Tax=Polytolypa hystricis (strain UAMH7299) TaxID=1447883 RepID=A0A2B7YFP4_POLH7|nr:hypothetical protein AJ80_03927 [Polytolypa hystricis UAMH7299]